MVTVDFTPPFRRVPMVKGLEVERERESVRIGGGERGETEGVRKRKRACTHFLLYTIYIKDVLKCKIPKDLQSEEARKFLSDLCDKHEVAS